MVTADPLTLRRFVCGMGELCKQVCEKRKNFLQDSLHLGVNCPHAQSGRATKNRLKGGSLVQGAVVSE